MASNSETGYAKNAANLGTLISSVTGYGVKYKPAKELIQLANLEIVSTNANEVLKEEHTALSVYNNAKADRKVVFKPLNKLITRAYNILKSSGASDQSVGTANSIVRELRGTRATPKPTEPGAKINSSSQLGYDNKVNNFDKFIKFLQGIPQYAPNESDLKIISLTTLYTDLKEKNDAVVAANTTLENVRIKRDEIFDAPDTGLIDVALDSKIYIKGVYGATSPQYKQVSKLLFKRPTK